MKTERFKTAVSYLAPEICGVLMNISGEKAKTVCEIRLRTGKPVCAVTFSRSFFVTRQGRLTSVYDENVLKADARDIKESFNRICAYSVYSYAKDIASGFITVGGGHRAGIYGTAVYDGNSVSSVRNIGGINLRIARQIKGCGERMMREVLKHGQISFLICGAPSSGKTTVLRDTARYISDVCEKKVSVIDERGEIASVRSGEAQNDVGLNTDVLDGYMKKDGIMQAVRTLSPDYIVCDEIGSQEDFEAIECGMNSGINFIATIHANDIGELSSKKDFRKFLKASKFKKAVFLSKENPCEVREYVGISPDGEFVL